MFADKTILITGGTGSFGSTVLARLMQGQFGEIRIFSRDEKKQEELRHKVADERVKFYIGDVREYGSVRDAMRGVDFVFHAAALKQVPSCEFYPLEAVRTNILGAENVLNAAIENEVRKVVVLSTDKAVYPINAMGMSKALMEKLTIAKSRQNTKAGTVFCATRYGNVMASRGSVIPLFVEQLMAGRPLTITDPSMTRFLMSLEDSVDLVLYAFQEGRQGDIFVQKSPASTISDLALGVMKLIGRETEIQVIGTRHGEKLYETLVGREEVIRAFDEERYFRIPCDDRDLNYNKYFSAGETQVSEAEDYTSHNTTRLDVDGVVKLLKTLDMFKDYR